MAVDPALSAEGLRYDIYSEVSFPAGAMPGMALVLGRLINHGQTLRHESLGQLSCDKLLGSHGLAYPELSGGVNPQPRFRSKIVFWAHVKT